MTISYEKIAQYLAIKAADSGADASVLDGLVTEVSVDESRLNEVPENETEFLLVEMELAATEINNAGLAAQIGFLLQRGVAQADIETALGLSLSA